jgi:hypothetical protein
MKAERRQELKTNELGAFLLDAGDWAQSHATQLGGAAAIAIIAIVGMKFLEMSRASAVDKAILSIADLNFDVSAADSSFSALNDIIEDASSRDVKMVALTRKAAAAMNLVRADGNFHPQYLDKAAEAYEELAKAFPDRMPVVGMALGVLATIEEDRFLVDGDLKHKEKAKEYLTRLVNEPPFKGTPFQTAAAQRLGMIDDIFQVITLADPLPEAKKVATDGPNANQPTAVPRPNMRLKLNADGTTTVIEDENSPQ